MSEDEGSAEADGAARERRAFLRKFGRFAVATTPLITAMLSTSARADFFSGIRCPPYPHSFCEHHHRDKDGDGDGDDDGHGHGDGGDRRDK